MSEPFVHRVEVHFYEVDQVGVVFNAWYLAWCDDARLAYLASRGYGLEEARAADALPLVRHADIEWLASLQAGDHAEIVVRPVSLFVPLSRCWFSFSTNRLIRSRSAVICLPIRSGSAE